MSLPLKVYKSLNYLQLAVSVYSMFWLQRFFVESVQCNMIENRASVTPYVLHYGSYLFPDCSAIGNEWTMGYWESILLRIVMIAWIVTSVFVYFRIRKIKRLISESEPVEFINPNRGEGSKSRKKKEKKKVSLIQDLKEIFPTVSFPRLLRILASVTVFWVVALLLFQNSILSYISRYVEEDKYIGQIQDLVIRHSKSGVSSIYLYVDQQPVLLRSDRNIVSFANMDKLTGGVFEGLENYDLEDPFLDKCLEGATVEVYARRSSTYYTLDGNKRYYIKFVSAMPTCQRIYRSNCVGNGDLYAVGESMLIKDEDITCLCTQDGFSCTAGIDNEADQGDASTCSYFNKTYYPGEGFVTKDGCGTCECDNGNISCSELDCELSEYDVSKEFELPIYYWFVDEPEPSQVVRLFAGRADTYEAVAYKAFGQMPKTELTLNNGRSMLIFSSKQSTEPFVTSEAFAVEGNEAYPELARVYSPSLNKYVYVSKLLPAEACQQTLGDGRICAKGDLSGLSVECISEDSNYGACDNVMRTFTIE